MGSRKCSGESMSQTAYSSRSFTTDLHQHPKYRPDIDGLRAVAIIPVVLFHAYPAILPGGFVGVDIFFVISGFLISSIIFKGLRREDFSFLGFYANRVKRIFPALVLVLGVCFVFGWFALLPDEYRQLGKHIAGGAGYIENFVLRREAGYFDTKSDLKPLMHLWSLGIEEQFYLTYPFLLWLVWRLRSNLLALLVPLAAASFALNIWRVHSDPVGTFFLPQTRFWELFAGGTLAYLQVFTEEVRARLPGHWARLPSYFFATELPRMRAAIVSNVLSTLGMFLVGLAIFRLHDQNAFPGWWALFPVCGASLLILAGPAAWINRRVLSSSVAVFVGLISYPLYLWHWPLLSFPQIIQNGEVSSITRICAIILALVLSWATWRFVENPIRFGRRIWIKTAALALTSVVVGGLGYAAYRGNGFPFRFKNLSSDLNPQPQEERSTPDCRERVGYDKMEYCRSSRTGPPSVLLLGDSHAGSLYSGLANAYGQRAELLMNLGAPACVPFYDTESYRLGERQQRNCKLVVNRMLEFATSSPSVHTIILAMRGPLNMSGQGFGHAEAGDAPKRIVWYGAPRNSTQAEMFVGALRNTIKHLSASGKNIVLFMDWPELGFDPKSCLPRPLSSLSHRRALCGVARAEVEARNQAYREAIFEMQKEFSGLQVFDPFPYLCDSSACYATKDGRLLYLDDDHLSAAGAAYLSGKFLGEPLADK